MTLSLRRLDWILLGSVLALVALSALLVWSATSHGGPDRRRLDACAGQQSHHRHRAAVRHLLGRRTGGCAIARIVYLLSVSGLVLVLTMGSTINGSRSWLRVLGLSIQPSEFAKVALVAGVAMILGEKHDERGTGISRSTPGDADVLLVLALAAVPMGLIMLQPDFGTVMVLVFVILGHARGQRRALPRWVLGPWSAPGSFGGAILQFHLLEPYQEARLTSFVAANKEASTAAGYNVDQAITAIANGGLFGRGLFHGTQTQGQFVPEQQTDFVFTVAGEELGFFGACGILLLLGVVLWRALSIAFNWETRSER